MTEENKTTPEETTGTSSPFTLKEPPAFKPPAVDIAAPPPFSLKPVTTSNAPPSFSSPPSFAQQQKKPGHQQPPPPAGGYPVISENPNPMAPMQPMQPMKPMAPMQPMQPIQPAQGYPQPQQHPPPQHQQHPPPQHHQHPPPQQPGAPIGHAFSNPNVGFTPQQAPVAPNPQKEDQGQQILSKLQQFMNQMNSFMKSVDARLTTLEKMVQQVATVQNQQSQALDGLRANAYPPPSHPSGPSMEPPRDARVDQSTSTPPPYLPDPSPPSSSMPDFRSPTSYAQKSRQELDDEEMAKRLQQEFNLEAQKTEAKRAASEPSQTAGTEECPMCHMVLPLKDLELHVQSHLDATEGKPRPSPSASANQKPQEEKSLWDRIFGGNEEGEGQQQQQGMYPVQYGGQQGVYYPNAAYGGQQPPQGYGYLGQ